MTELHEAQIQDGSFEFLAIFLEGLPFIFLGTIVSGFLGTYLPRNAFERFLPKNRTLAIFVSGFLGAVFPVCECAVVPVIRRLVKNGLPVSCALTYMLAAPIFNPVTAISTYKAFNNSYQIAGSRMMMGWLIAVAVGLVMARIAHKHFLKPSAIGDGNEHKHPRTLAAAMNNSLRDFMDVGLYFTIGVILTALLKTTVIDPTSDFWKGLAENSFVATPAMMVLAFILSLCSTSDAFIAANIGNFKYAPKLAFMVLGPMMDAKLIFLYSTVFRWKFILCLFIGLFFATWGLSLAFEHGIGSYEGFMDSYWGSEKEVAP
ncbi:permease [bacterium]|nr:permease [Akkermansiaceae bacterium]MDB4485744.1 permease [bacterium]MDA8975500.1 permease [Akkermansiaceae bacterium]MDB4293774.1 permease [Akkermansiaceae bacterium]MDB4314179.1 permease [Akkermansiaceae bacterium]